MPLIASNASPDATIRTLHVAMAGNVITQPFARTLRGSLSDVADTIIRHHDFGQVVQALEADVSCDFLVLHLDHRWFFDIAPDAEAVQRAKELAGQIRDWLDRSRGTVLLNTIPHVVRSSVATDAHRQHDALHSIHQVFFDLSATTGRVLVVDVAGIVAEIGHANAVRERNRLLMQAPYTPMAATAIAAAYASTIRMASRPRRKVIVVDADNTLWGGVVGEVGPDGVAVDRENPGITHFIFQKQLKRLRSLGLVLCAVTKNNDQDFLDVFSVRQMPLTLDDFTIIKSNWKPKSDNISDIIRELNIGADAVVFIDDNPFEIEEVRTRLPEVECFLFPNSQPEEALVLLERMECLRTPTLTEEDGAKAELYRAEAQRREARASATTPEDYIASLNIDVQVSCNQAAHVRRIAQLANKTNQFNLTCRRYSEAEIEQAMVEGNVYSFRVTDRFGDMGIVAVAIVRNGIIENLLMSCRALGRHVEVAILRYVCDRHADALGLFRSGPRNQMVERFYDDNGFSRLDEIEDGTRRYRMEQGPQNEQHFVIQER